MDKILEIKIIPVFDKFAWKIVKQDEEILERRVFADDDERVKSTDAPYYDGERNILFLRGYNRDEDDVFHLCTAEETKKIEEKVKKINQKYSQNFIKRFPRGKLVFYVDIHGNIEYTRELNRDFTYSLLQAGNYFATREEAEKSLLKKEN